MSRKRPEALAQRRFRASAREFAGLPLDKVFDRIHETNLWGSPESRSGLGSEVAETAELRTAVPALLRRFAIRSILDIPCGDFGWLSAADLSGIDYTGADIVGALVESNQVRLGSSGRRFLRLDLTVDSLPRADLVLCRDCLVHLSYSNIALAVANVAQSGAKYLLTTTFLEFDGNTDIQDGDWRPLNFEQPPFSFPSPIETIVEGCTEGGGAYRDKALGLWRVSDLATESALGLRTALAGRCGVRITDPETR